MTENKTKCGAPVPWEWRAFMIFWYFQIFYAAGWALFFIGRSVYVIGRYAYHFLMGITS